MSQLHLPFTEPYPVTVEVTRGTMVPMSADSGSPGIQKEMVTFECRFSDNNRPELNTALLGKYVSLVCTKQDDATELGAMAPLQIIGVGELAEHNGNLALHITGQNSGIRSAPNENEYYFLYIMFIF